MDETTDEQKEDFRRLRQGPTGRASIFAPELLLVRDRKIEDEKKKTPTRSVNDVLMESISKIFVEMSDADKAQLANVAKTIRHADDLDGAILAVAAFLYISLPGYIDLSNQQVQNSLSSSVMAQRSLTNWAEEVIRLRVKESMINQNLVDRVKTDIISYYDMFFNKYDD